MSLYKTKLAFILLPIFIGSAVFYHSFDSSKNISYDVSLIEAVASIDGGYYRLNPHTCVSIGRPGIDEGNAGFAHRLIRYFLGLNYMIFGVDYIVISNGYISMILKASNWEHFIPDYKCGSVLEIDRIKKRIIWRS